ncbi:MAG TPA: hypothetical protein VNU71_14580 [Burkholderiaceae bacterium]|nr:hypothetical protein [Burkholderiaceae bacterium]
MKLKAIIPAPVDVGREAIVVIAGALLAAFVIGQLPSVRDWIKAQWGVAKAPDPV